MSASNSTINSDQSCYHCALPVPAGSDYPVEIDGQARAMCCPGCQAVAMAIVDGGLENFYRFRTEKSARPDESAQDFSVYDLVDVQSDFVLRLDGDEGSACGRAQLLLEGITCAACSWLIERHLSNLTGVSNIRVNATTHRLSVDFDPAQTLLSKVMCELDTIGYKPQPATDDRQQALLKKEKRTALMRLSLAGFGMMQVGMVAIALYAGAIQGMDSNWQSYLRWISLLIATPVVLYSARPFYSAAWRNLKHRHLSMDVPVSLAIIGAYLASCWATLTGSGEVYFDSVSMFTFFLLLGRFLEMRARHSNKMAAGNATQLMPLSAQRLVTDNVSGQIETVTVPLKSLVCGDRVLVKSGETLPCDGVVVAGQSSVIEALLTGESRPIQKAQGDYVVAGTLNGDSALEVEVSAVGAQTQLSAIERLMSDASLDKPRQVAIADRLSRYFVAAVLIVSAVVFSTWWAIDRDHALWVTLSVLVVTCPCALALATPAALTAATRWLRRHGLLITRGHVLESLSKVTTVVLDKTGTLTLGHLSIERVEVAPNCDLTEREVLALAAALEFSSSHPIASAFKPYSQGLNATQVRHFTAAGVEGFVSSAEAKNDNLNTAKKYRLGAPEFALDIVEAAVSVDASRDGQWLLLASTEGPLAWISLSDQARESAPKMLQELTAQGIKVELLSGDRSSAVADMANTLGIENYIAAATPEDKLDRIRVLQSRGEIVLMVGDGVNDVPVLAGADVSVAMAQATDLAKTRADSVLLSGDLSIIPRAMLKARDARVVIRQNLAWSLTYNIVALPMAAMGLIPPWAAAIGMSSSSLVVIANALRLNR